MQEPEGKETQVGIVDYQLSKFDFKLNSTFISAAFKKSNPSLRQ